MNALLTLKEIAVAVGDGPEDCKIFLEVTVFFCHVLIAEVQDCVLYVMGRMNQSQVVHHEMMVVMVGEGMLFWVKRLDR